MIPTISLAHICTEILEVLGSTNSNLDFASLAMILLLIPKENEPSLETKGKNVFLMPNAFGIITKFKVMVLILLGQMNSLMDKTIWLLQGFPGKGAHYFSNVATFTTTGPLSKNTCGGISLMAVLNSNCALRIKGIWGSQIKTLRILVAFFSKIFPSYTYLFTQFSKTLTMAAPARHVDPSNTTDEAAS